jgi:hypothetical protein
MNRSPITKRKTKRRSEFEREFEAMRPVIRARSRGNCEALRIIDAFVSAQDYDPATEAAFEAWSEKECANRATELHHRKIRKQGGSNSEDNLADLCIACHQWVHANPEMAYRLGLLLHAWDGEEL